MAEASFKGNALQLLFEYVKLVEEEDDGSVLEAFAAGDRFEDFEIL